MYERAFIGQRLGKIVRAERIINKPVSGEYDVWVDLLDEIVELFKEGSGDQTTLKSLLTTMESVKSQKFAIKGMMKAAANTLLVKQVGPNLGELSTNVQKILQKLSSDMTAAGDYVKAMNIAHTDPVYDQANTGDGTLVWDGTPTDQSALHGNRIVCECISEAANLGTFSVTSSILGRIGTATVATAFDAKYGNAAGNTACGVKFTIGDGANDWDIGDKIYIETWCYPDITEANDGANQFTGWQADRLDLNRSADASRIVYVTLADVAGTRTVNVYSDAGKTDLIATYSGGDGAPIYCAPQGENGIGIRVTLAWTIDDADITLTFAADYSLFQFFIVNILLQKIFLPTAGAGTQFTESWAE